MDIQLVSNIIKEEVIKAFQDQGHNFTGAWENNLKTIEKNIADRWVVEVWGADYTKHVNYKMAPGKASMKMFYFVKKYVEKRMNKQEKEAGTIAAKIINSWFKKGRPTAGSLSFSKTGKRDQFIEVAISVLTEKLLPFFTEELKKDIQKLITNEIQLINTV